MSVYVDLVRYRELFGSLFRRDLRARYKGTIFGVAWSLVNPLMLMAIYVLVFSLLWQVENINHYPLFLLCGLSSVALRLLVAHRRRPVDARLRRADQEGALPAAARRVLGRGDAARAVRRACSAG